MDNSTGVFRVYLTLTSDRDRDLQMLIDRIREEIPEHVEGWEQTVESGKTPIYHQLGLMKMNQGEHQEATKYYEKFIRIKEETISLPHMSLANSDNNGGSVYFHTGDNAKALKLRRRKSWTCAHIQRNSLDFFEMWIPFRSYGYNLCSDTYRG